MGRAVATVRARAGLLVVLSGAVLVSVAATDRAAIPARNGSIRGRVELRKVLPPIERRPGVADVASAAVRDVSDRLRSVVYLETAPRGAFETSEPGHAVMDQHN
jgi:hypothetical protein